MCSRPKQSNAAVLTAAPSLSAAQQQQKPAGVHPLLAAGWGRAVAGRWRGSGDGDDGAFGFDEQVALRLVPGKPVARYSQASWNVRKQQKAAADEAKQADNIDSDENAVGHTESGWLRFLPNGVLEMLVVDNNGISQVYRGTHEHSQDDAGEWTVVLDVQSQALPCSGATGADKRVEKLHRTLTFKTADRSLHSVLRMAAGGREIATHLTSVLQRSPDFAVVARRPLAHPDPFAITQTPWDLITADELDKRGNDALVVVDVRQPRDDNEQDEGGSDVRRVLSRKSAKHAQPIPLGTLIRTSEIVPLPELAKRLGDSDPASSTLVVVDRYGTAATVAQKLLRQKGFANVLVLLHNDNE